jgi:hypothetical protein
VRAAPEMCSRCLSRPVTRRVRDICATCDDAGLCDACFALHEQEVAGELAVTLAERGSRTREGRAGTEESAGPPG